MGSEMPDGRHGGKLDAFVGSFEETGGGRPVRTVHHARTAVSLLLALAVLCAVMPLVPPGIARFERNTELFVWGLSLPERVRRVVYDPASVSGGWALPSSIRKCPSSLEGSIWTSSPARAELSERSSAKASSPAKERAASRTCLLENDPVQAMDWLARRQQALLSGTTDPVPSARSGSISHGLPRSAGGSRSSSPRFDSRVTVAPFSLREGVKRLRGEFVASANPRIAASRQGRGGRRPVVVCVSGLAMGMDTCRWATGSLLAPLGWETVDFDPLGIAPNSQSQGSMLQMSAVTEARDLEAVLRYLRSLPWVDSSRIALVGGSQGGLASTLVASRHPSWIWKLALAYPALMIPTLVHYAFPDKALIPRGVRYGTFGLGRRYALDVWDVDPWAAASRIRQRTLIVQGTADVVVDPSVSFRAVGTIPDARLLLVRGGTHGFTGGGRESAMARVEEYLGQ